MFIDVHGFEACIHVPITYQLAEDTGEDDLGRSLKMTSIRGRLDLENPNDPSDVAQNGNVWCNSVEQMLSQLQHRVHLWA